MGFPQRLQKDEPQDTGNPSAGAAEFRNLKLFIEDLFGVLDTQSYSAKAMDIGLAGQVTVAQERLLFQNGSATIPAFGFAGATGTGLSYDGTNADISILRNGTRICSLGVLAGDSYINAKAPPYNAVGDGVTDDTAALQAALTAAANKVLILPYGTYLHTGLTIANPMIVRGVATMQSAQTMLSYTGSGTGITISGNSGTLQDLVLQTATGNIGVDLSSTLYHRFLNVRVLGNATTQYLANDAYYIQWRGGTIQGKSGTSGTTRGITSTVNFNANLIDGVRFLMGTGATDYWTAVAINTAGVSGTSNGSALRDCIFDGGYEGGVAIHAYAGTTGLSLVGNRLEGNGQNFLLQDDDSFGITVLGGSLQGSSGVPAPRLFDLSGGDVFIAGVDIREATEGIHLGAAARRVTEMNNSWTNVTTKVSSSEGLAGILSLYNGQMLLEGGYHTLSERSANPTAEQVNRRANVYVKGDKLVVQFDNGGTVRYLTLDLTQATGAAVWASNTVAP